MPLALFMIAARDEEKSISRALQSVLSQRLPKGFSAKVLVCDNASTDRTAMTVRGIAKGHGNVFLFREPRPGKARALNLLLEKAFSEKGFKEAKVLVFCDADVELEAGSARRIIGFLLSRPRLKAAAGTLRARKPKFRSFGHELAHTISVLPIESESNRFLRGGFYAVRAGAMRRTRFPEDLLLEDVWLSLRLGAERVAVCGNAVARFNAVGNWGDFERQSIRHVQGLCQLMEIFPRRKIEEIARISVSKAVLDFASRGRKSEEWNSLPARKKLILALSIPAYYYVKARAALRHIVSRPEGRWESVGSTK